MEMGLLRGLIALVTMLTFLGICAWAYRPGNRRRFEDDALLVFEPDEIPVEGEVIGDRDGGRR